MGKTFSEKVFSLKAGRDVHAGEIVTLEPDYILSHDNSAAILKKLPAIGVTKLKYPGRAVIVLDHVTPAADNKHAANHKAIREFVAQQGITHFYDVGRGVRLSRQANPRQRLAHPHRRRSRRIRCGHWTHRDGWRVGVGRPVAALPGYDAP
jgi:homoaconitase/3-isopropylmalate dehydratase large subunit